jgi:hypothetical protein
LQSYAPDRQPVLAQHRIVRYALLDQAFGVCTYISRDFAYPRVLAEISGSREIIRGPSVTLSYG